MAKKSVDTRSEEERLVADCFETMMHAKDFYRFLDDTVIRWALTENVFSPLVLKTYSGSQLVAIYRAIHEFDIAANRK